LAAVECARKRVLIDQRAACDVDQVSAGFGDGEDVAIEEVTGGR